MSKPTDPTRFSKLRCLLAAFALTFGLAGTASATPNALKNHDICAYAIDRAESGTSLPRELMTAISRVESGRWDPGRKELSAWPWTVTKGADGQYFPTKAKALAHIRKLQARGITNIDVGCMQINLRYHPDAFENLNAALDPVTNARYAASLLGRLFSEHRSWGEAVKRYHSSNPKFNRPQPEPVLRDADDPRRQAAEAHRKAVIARHRAERARILAKRDAQFAASGMTATQ